MIMPPGYRFIPTDEELISAYLLRRVMGLPLPCHVILETDLYGQNAAPCDAFGGIDESNSCYWQSEDHETKGVTKKTIYVFTKLVKASPKSSRVSRTAGRGTWSGQTGGRTIKNFRGETIGSRKMLTFQDSDTGKQESTRGSASGGGYHWIMHEYSLDGIYRNLGPNNVDNDVVLCKITRCFKGNSTSTIDNNIPQPVATNADECCFSSARVDGDEIPQLTSIENINPASSSSLLSHKRSSDCEGLKGCDSKRPRISPSSPSPWDQALADLENEEDLLLPTPAGIYFEDYMQIWIDCLQPNDHHQSSTVVGDSFDVNNNHSS